MGMRAKQELKDNAQVGIVRADEQRSTNKTC